MKRPVRLGAGEKLVLTANRLLDGCIVWRDDEGKWEMDISRAAILSAEEMDGRLQVVQDLAQREGVVGVYEVVVRDGLPPEPVTVREKIRAYGPTVHSGSMRETRV